MKEEERRRFDGLLEEVMEQIPPSLRELIEEVPVIVLDRPTREILKDLGIDPNDEEEARTLCGLHSGTSNTERSVERSGELPPSIHLFREGIINLALGEEGWSSAEAEDRVFEEIWVTLLHEIGHQFGLDEDDLERLGYA